MDPEMSLDAARLPEGTQITYTGRVYTARADPPATGGRWWAVDDRAGCDDFWMTTEVRAGRAVIGIHQASIDMYQAVLADCRDHS
jgi:hypothetical protein